MAFQMSKNQIKLCIFNDYLLTMLLSRFLFFENTGILHLKNSKTLFMSIMTALPGWEVGGGDRLKGSMHRKRRYM